MKKKKVDKISFQVRQCIRKTTTRDRIRECVAEFSSSSPVIACKSSKKLLQCSIPVIGEKCGEIATQFVTQYIDKFGTTVDPLCKLNLEQNGLHVLLNFELIFSY